MLAPEMAQVASTIARCAHPRGTSSLVARRQHARSGRTLAVLSLPLAKVPPLPLPSISMTAELRPARAVRAPNLPRENRTSGGGSAPTQITICDGQPIRSAAAEACAEVVERTSRYRRQLAALTPRIAARASEAAQPCCQTVL